MLRGNLPRLFLAAAVVLALLSNGSRAISADEKELTGPFTPDDALATFQLPQGFRIELVAAEPDVLDPVAMSFDADGRLYVIEMRDYPLGPPAPPGRIRLLEDRDGDGRMDHSTVFADGLKYPTSVMAWREGVLVIAAPDLFYLEDTDGDGTSDVRKLLYTGFGEINPQHRANGLTFGLDNWIYGANGFGDIRAVGPDDAQTYSGVRGDFRIRPDTVEFEVVSGRSQFALALDDWNNRFINNNANHIRHPVLPWHYLQRNPDLSAGRVLEDISDHGALARVFPISAIEQRFNEFHHAGYTTTACGLCVCRSRALPREYWGNSFCCEPLHNLIHRDVLQPQGVSFVASRAADEAERDFLASRDNWFRPVNLVEGPDGGMYIADFYRPVIEHPFGIPVELQKGLDFRAGDDRGRIWRIVHASTPQRDAPRLENADSEQLVSCLDDANAWWRMTAQRLLFERQDRSAIPLLERLAAETSSPTARVHALWTLDGLSALRAETVAAALDDPHPNVREHALRLAESRTSGRDALAAAVWELVDDENERVRFQLALTAGELTGPGFNRERALSELAKLIARDGHDSRFRTAALSSVFRREVELLAELRDECPEFLEEPRPGAIEFVRALSDTVAHRQDEGDMVSLCTLITREHEPEPAAWQRAALFPLVRRLHRAGVPLSQVTEKAGAGSVFDRWARAAERMATSDRYTTAERVEAIGLLALAPKPDHESLLSGLLSPHEPQEVQQAAVRALSAAAGRQTSQTLLSRWPACTAAVREDVLAALLSRADRVPLLLDAIESGTIRVQEIEAARRDQLVRYPDPEISSRAQRLLEVQPPAERLEKIAAVVAHVTSATGDVDRGRKLFLAKCANCHNRRTDTEGILHLSPGAVDVGPGLGALRTRSEEALLADILDPNRAVDPRFLNYVVATEDGRVVTGMILQESPASVTLQNGKELTEVARNEIADIKNTGLSLMPEGFEMNLSLDELNDLIEFLRH